MDVSSAVCMNSIIAHLHNVLMDIGKHFRTISPTGMISVPWWCESEEFSQAISNPLASLGGPNTCESSRCRSCGSFRSALKILSGTRGRWVPRNVSPCIRKPSEWLRYNTIYRHLSSYLHTTPAFTETKRGGRRRKKGKERSKVGSWLDLVH